MFLKPHLNYAQIDLIRFRANENYKHEANFMSLALNTGPTRPSYLSIIMKGTKN